MAVAGLVAQGDRQEALVVVGNAVHLIEQHRDDFFERCLVAGANRQPVMRAIAIELLGRVRLQADRFDQWHLRPEDIVRAPVPQGAG